MNLATSGPQTFTPHKNCDRPGRWCREPGTLSTPPVCRSPWRPWCRV